MTGQQLLDEAITASSGVSALASVLGLTNKAVYQWRKRGVPVAWQRVIQTEILNKKRRSTQSAHGVAATEKEGA